MISCCCNKKESDFTKIEDLLQEYSTIKGSLITILQGAQETYGYLPTDVIYHIAKRTNNTPAKVMGVATFYTQFRFKPIGKNLILLCLGTACHVNGSDSIAKAIFEELNIGDGETTEDGLFTLSFVACLGCCSLSPVMMINNETYGSLTPAKTKEILSKIREEESK